MNWLFVPVPKSTDSLMAVNGYRSIGANRPETASSRQGNLSPRPVWEAVKSCTHSSSWVWWRPHRTCPMVSLSALTEWMSGLDFKSAFRSGWLNLINGRVTSRLIRLSGLGASQQQMPVESHSCLELVPDQSWGIATLKNWQPSQIPIPVYQKFRQEGGRSECP